MRNGGLDAPTTHGDVLDELRAGPLRFVLVTHGPGVCLSAHEHDAAKLCIVLGGGTTEACGAVDIVTPGPLEPVFRPARFRHENQYHARGARSLLVEIDPSFAAARGAKGGLAFDRAAARRAATDLVSALNGPRSSRARSARAAALSVLACYETSRRLRVPAWLERAREALADAAGPPTLDALARDLGVHPVYLAQSFRARWGTTTRAFVRSHRVFRAMQSIRGGSTLAEAAVIAGFADQSHMTRAFRAERGAPPAALLRAAARP